MSVSVSILAAGQGKRMHSDKPKVLHELAGWPMVRYVLEIAAQVSDRVPVLVVGHGAAEARRTLGEDVVYVEQPEQLGTAHAVLRCRTYLQGQADTILVLYGDTPLVQPDTLRRMLDHHRATRSTVTILTFVPPTSQGYGRILRGPDGRVLDIVEDRVATEAQKQIRECNSGILCFCDTWLWPNLAALEVSETGEYFLTDLIARAAGQDLAVEALQVDDPSEVMGIDNRVKLAQAEQIMRQRLNEKWMLAGVTLVDPATTYLEPGIELGQDTVILPNTHIRGTTRIGRHGVIGPNTVLTDCQIGDRCSLEAVFAEGATVEDDVDVGPFAHLRAGAYLARGVHMGNFGEVKKSYLGPGTKMGHFSYIGDATIGAEVNIGAGTVTCNYDGQRKNRTIIGEGAFIGSDTMLVAPVEVGARAKTGAGSVVTHDIPANSVAYGVPARVHDPLAPGSPPKNEDPQKESQ